MYNNVFENAIQSQGRGDPFVYEAAAAAGSNVGSPMFGEGSSFGGATGAFSANNLKFGIGAIQTLGSLWNSYSQNKLAEKSLKLQTRAFETNLGNQTKTYNTALEDRIRSRYNTEGRSSEEAQTYIERNKL